MPARPSGWVSLRRAGGRRPGSFHSVAWGSDACVAGQRERRHPDGAWEGRRGPAGPTTPHDPGHAAGEGDLLCSAGSGQRTGSTCTGWGLGSLHRAGPPRRGGTPVRRAARPAGQACPAVSGATPRPPTGVPPVPGGLGTGARAWCADAHAGPPAQRTVGGARADTRQAVSERQRAGPSSGTGRSALRGPPRGRPSSGVRGVAARRRCRGPPSPGKTAVPWLRLRRWSADARCRTSSAWRQADDGRAELGHLCAGRRSVGRRRPTGCGVLCRTAGLAPKAPRSCTSNRSRPGLTSSRAGVEGPQPGALCSDSRLCGLCGPGSPKLSLWGGTVAPWPQLVASHCRPACRWHQGFQAQEAGQEPAGGGAHARTPRRPGDSRQRPRAARARHSSAVNRASPSHAMSLERQAHTAFPWPAVCSVLSPPRATAVAFVQNAACAGRPPAPALPTAHLPHATLDECHSGGGRCSASRRRRCRRGPKPGGGA